jgi:DNA gyrase subunit A
MKEQYGDQRRTTIAGQVGITLDEIVQEEEALVAVTRRGHIRRGSIDQRRSVSAGRGKDVVMHLLHVSGGDDLFIIATDGRATWLPVHQVPDIASQRGGIPLADVRPSFKNANIVSVLALPRGDDAPEGYLLLGTAGGKVKRSTLTDFIKAVGKGVTQVISLDQGDWVVNAHTADGKEEVLIVTRQGKGIRFAQEEVRPMGLPAGGVGAIRLAPGDVIVSVQLVRKGGQLLTLTTNGWAKLSSLTRFPAQKRYGTGVNVHKVSRRNGDVAVACVVGRGGHTTILTAKGGVERLALKDLPRMGRDTLGKLVVASKADDDPTASRSETISVSVKTGQAKQRARAKSKATKKAKARG